MSWSLLSEDIWKHILQYVPLSDRLKSCSTVSSMLHRAAAAATREIQLEKTVQSSSSLWLRVLRHGQHLSSLRLRAPGETLTQLPCPNLLDLDLSGTPLHLGASSTDPGVLHSCSRLTRLRLSNCGYSGRCVGLPELRDLELMYNHPRGGAADDLVPSTVLQQLQHLTRLHLQHEVWPTMQSLQHVSCLTNLQHLLIFQEGLSLSPSTTPGTSSLTALRTIVFSQGELDPVVLQDCTLLEGLVLTRVTISAGGAAALQLHSLVGRLQQLRVLRFIEVRNWPVAASAAATAAAAYASLTASNKLQVLKLNVDHFPPGVWQFMFSSDRQLPALEVLSVTRSEQWDVHGPQPAAALGTADLCCLASCCPGLQELHICLQPGAQLGSLAQLSALNMLGAEAVDAATLASLTALSGLRNLEWLCIIPGGPIVPTDLLCLTALTALTQLAVDTDAAPDLEDAADVHMSLYAWQVCCMLGWYSHGMHQCQSMMWHDWSVVGTSK